MFTCLALTCSGEWHFFSFDDLTYNCRLTQSVIFLKCKCFVLFLLNLKASRSKHFIEFLVVFCTILDEKLFISSISIWLYYLKTVLLVRHLLSQTLPPPLRFFFSYEGNYIGTIQNLGKKFSIEMFLINAPRNSSSIELKKHTKLHAEFLWLCI